MKRGYATLALAALFTSSACGDHTVLFPVAPLQGDLTTLAAEQEDFAIVSESAVFDPATHAVSFTIEFNQLPDFFSVDEFGRQAHSFQYYVVGDPGLPHPAKFDAIIRGEEIHLTLDRIPIRNVEPADPDPAAGGWGTVRGVVPFQLTGTVLTFSTPLELISDHSLDGNFEYLLESYQFGSLTGHLEGRSVVIAPGVAIDIKPGGVPNTVNPRSKGVIPVAILTTPTFDARTVDPLSVAFGPQGARELHGRGHFEDVDRDGDIDLVLHFATQDTGITCGMASASLAGRTLDGKRIYGSDSIQTVGCK